MEFTVEERLSALSLLPPEGTLITMRIVHELRLALAFSEEDLAALQFKEEGDRLFWNDLDPKEIKIGHQASVIIHDALKKLDEDGKLRESHLPLVEKFEYGE